MRMELISSRPRRNGLLKPTALSNLQARGAALRAITRSHSNFLKF